MGNCAFKLNTPKIARRTSNNHILIRAFSSAAIRQKSLSIIWPLREGFLLEFWIELGVIVL
jgi:hypothetical protein